MSSSEILGPVREDMNQMAENLRNIVGNRHPLLMAAADQIFGAGGKKLRPAMVFLVARATTQLGGLRWGNTQLSSSDIHLYPDMLSNGILKALQRLFISLVSSAQKFSRSVIHAIQKNAGCHLALQAVTQ